MGHVTSKIQVLLVASYLNLYIDKHWYVRCTSGYTVLQGMRQITQRLRLYAQTRSYRQGIVYIKNERGKETNHNQGRGTANQHKPRRGNREAPSLK